MKLLVILAGWVAWADAAECTDQTCFDSSAKTSIMQMRRSSLNKRTSSDSDNYAELVEMMKAVKMQVGGKLFSEVTPEVMEAIQLMIGLCETIFEAILSDHNAANAALSTQATALINAYDDSVEKYGDAQISDAAVTTCRDEEKAKLILWEECVADLHVCEANCVTEIQNVSDKRYFDYNIATNYGMERDNKCVFLSMQSSTLDAPLSCANYEFVTNGYGQLEADFNAALALFTEAEETRDTVCNACDEHRNTCGELRVAYLGQHVTCTTTCEVNYEKMCLFGYSYQEKCIKWDLIEETVDTVEYATGAEGLGTDYSHPDRVAEYNAVAEIKCLLESYQEGGTFDEVTECDKLTYEARIGLTDYQVEKRDQSVSDGHVCIEDTHVVTFTGTQYEIGPTSSHYEQVVWTPTATLRPSDDEPFYFCPDHDCEVVEVCGSIHALSEFHSYAAMEAEGWVFNFDDDASSFQHDYASAGYYRGWNHGDAAGTVSLTLSGEGAVDVMFGNGADNADNKVLLKINGVTVAERGGGEVAVSHHNFQNGDTLTIQEDGGIILLGYVEFDCSGSPAPSPSSTEPPVKTTAAPPAVCGREGDASDFSAQDKMLSAGWSWDYVGEQIWIPDTTVQGSYRGWNAGVTTGDGSVPGTLSLTLQGTGTFTISFGNDHDAQPVLDDPTNIVVLFLNDQELARATGADERMTVSHAFQDGDVLKVSEYYGVALVHSISFDCSGDVAGPFLSQSVAPLVCHWGVGGMEQNLGCSEQGAVLSAVDEATCKTAGEASADCVYLEVTGGHCTCSSTCDLVDKSGTTLWQKGCAPASLFNEALTVFSN